MTDQPEPMHVKTSKGETFAVDPEFSSLFERHIWHISPQGYVERTTTTKGRKRVHFKLHRIVAGALLGQQVDHINGDKLDNRKENLRICTRMGNSANSKLRSDNKTGYKGVHKHRRGDTFQATIMHQQKPIYISRFQTALEAAMAYDNAAIALFGEFAKTNGDII